MALAVNDSNFEEIVIKSDKQQWLISGLNGAVHAE